MLDDDEPEISQKLKTNQTRNSTLHMDVALFILMYYHSMMGTEIITEKVEFVHITDYRLHSNISTKLSNVGLYIIV